MFLSNTCVLARRDLPLVLFRLLEAMHRAVHTLHTMKRPRPRMTLDDRMRIRMRRMRRRRRATLPPALLRRKCLPTAVGRLSIALTLCVALTLAPLLGALSGKRRRICRMLSCAVACTLLQRENLYLCTSKASKLSTVGAHDGALLCHHSRGAAADGVVAERGARARAIDVHARYLVFGDRVGLDRRIRAILQRPASSVFCVSICTFVLVKQVLLRGLFTAQRFI